MLSSKKLFKRIQLNQKGFSHDVIFAILVVVIVGAIGLHVLSKSRAATPTAASNGVTYFKGHCKDNAHLVTKTAPSGSTLTQAADVEVKVLTPIPGSLECINDTTYNKPVYTFFVGGKEELHMETSGATYVQTQLASAGLNGTNIELEHTDNGNFILYRNFTPAAATKVADELTTLLNGGGGGVTYFQGFCVDDLHLNIVAAPSGGSLLQAADVVVKKNTATDTMQCANNHTYRGAVYTLVIKGKDGINVLPVGATYVKNHFATSATNSTNVELQHKVSGNFAAYKDFSSAAANKLATELKGFGL